MKTLKFRESLARIILSGEKTTTWRLFDDKDIRQGDILSLLVWETKEEFAQAQAVMVKETRLGALTDEDWEGHERFSSDEEMFKTYELYYRRPVDKDTIVKIIRFRLVEVAG